MNIFYILALLFDMSIEVYNTLYAAHVKELRVRKIEAAVSYNIKNNRYNTTNS